MFFMNDKSHVIIASAGPVGLYLAINLVKLYRDQVKVTVADASLKDYKRPGVIAINALEVINSFLVQNTLPSIDVANAGCIPVNAMFIKDLQTCLSLAARFKLEAAMLFSEKNYVKASDYFQRSLSVFEMDHANTNWEEISKLYSNIAKATYHQGDYDLALKWARKGLEISQLHDTSMKDKIAVTINEILSAKCAHLLAFATNKLSDKQDISPQLEQISLLLKEISPTHSQYKLLSQRYETIQIESGKKLQP